MAMSGPNARFRRSRGFPKLERELELNDDSQLRKRCASVTPELRRFRKVQRSAVDKGSIGLNWYL